MAKYAQNTSVSVGKSKNEIERILQRYGAKQFIQGWDQQMAYVGFVFKERTIKLRLTLPPREDFTKTPAGRKRRNPDDALRAWEQACRQLWRAQALVIKAKLEAVESGIAAFEDEFLAYTCLPGGQTVSELIQPQIVESISSGKMPKLLTGAIK